MTASPPPDWLTRKEAAARLRVSVKTIDRMIADGRIAGATRFGRTVRIPRTSIDPPKEDAAAPLAA